MEKKIWPVVYLRELRLTAYVLAEDEEEALRLVDAEYERDDKFQSDVYDKADVVEAERFVDDDGAPSWAEKELTAENPVVW